MRTYADLERASSLGEILSIEVLGQPLDPTAPRPAVMITFANGKPFVALAENMGTEIELVCRVWDGVMSHRVRELSRATEEISVVSHPDREESVDFFDKPEVRFEEVVVDEPTDMDVPDEGNADPLVSRYRDLYGADAVLPSDLL